jgi:hypothetical protein
VVQATRSIERLGHQGRLDSRPCMFYVNGRPTGFTLPLACVEAFSSGISSATFVSSFARERRAPGICLPPRKNPLRQAALPGGTMAIPSGPIGIQVALSCMTRMRGDHDGSVPLSTLPD